jgi:hypothetical protein
MGMLEEVRTQLITDAVGVASVTSDWCIHLKFMPEMRSLPVICLYETSGSSPDMGFGSTTPRFKFPGLMVQTRGGANDYDGPKARIELAYDALIAIGGASLLTSVNYQLVLATQEPFPIGKDESNRWRFSCNFTVQKSPS